MGQTKSSIVLTYGDLQYHLIHTQNAYDDDPNNDIIADITPAIQTGDDSIEHHFDPSIVHALTIICMGRIGAKLDIIIEDVGLKGSVTIGSNRRAVETFVF